MGKKKKNVGPQPRTKDNLKPSSSERAAQFLVQHTGGLGLPSSFLSSTGTYGVCNTTTIFEDEGQSAEFVPVPQDPDALNLDSRLLGILKRLDKRDVTTKQKALRELSALLRSDTDVELSALIAILPYWSPIFCRLSDDPDRKVREYTQMAMCFLVRRVRSELRPYVKQVLPSWTYGSTDFHGAAANWAGQGLASAFPTSKRSEAYRLCAKQLLDFLENQIDSTVSHVSRLLETKKTVIRQPTEKQLEQDSENELALEKLARAVDFCGLITFHFAALPDNNPHLQRLRSLLSPENLWSRVSRAIELSLCEGHLLLGNSSIVHRSLYQLSKSLCIDEHWSQWLSQTPQGTHLASYLCASTLGQLGVKSDCEIPTAPQTSTLIPSSLRLEAGASCYCSCWDAAIACLTNLPDSLVWSIVDWRSSLAPQLERLLLHADVGLITKAYSYLHNLLSKLPINFDAIDETDCDLLQRVFIAATISGLERSLVPKSTIRSSALDEPQHLTPKHADPGLSSDLVSGVLRCAGFLLNKTVPSGSFSSLDDLYQSSPLLRAVMCDVILRLLGDALDASRVSAKPQLVCAQPPMYRRVYLSSVFSEIARLCVDLGKSDLHTKHLLLAHICDEIVRWSSEDPAVEMTDPCEADTKRSRLGLIDPLCLIEFADPLALFEHSPLPICFEPPAKPSRRHQSARGFTVTFPDHFDLQNEWCIGLFTSLSKQVQRRLSSTAVDASLRSCLYLALFCLHGHLSDDYPCLLPSFASTLLSEILPGLPEDIHCNSLSSSVIRGLTRAWSHSDEASPLRVPSDSICSQFFNELFPTILLHLPSDSANLFRNISNLFSHWLTYWCKKSVLLEATEDEVSSSLTNISLLFHTLCINHPKNGDQTHGLKESLLQEIDAWIQPFFSSGTVDMLTTHSLNMIHRLLVIQLIALESSSFPTNFDRRNRWCLQLGQLLFAMYRVHHFALVAQVLTPDSPLVVFTSATVNFAHLPALSLPTAFQRAERLLLFYASSRIRDPSHTADAYDVAHSIYNLLFKTVQYSPYVPPGLIRFSKSLATECPTPALASIWLSELSELIQKLSICPFTDSSSPRSALFNVPTRHLLPAFGLSVDRAHLASLVRLHQLGLQMELPCKLRTADSEHRQYIQCLGLLRAWLCSVSEPCDSCTELGWPALASSTSDDLSDSPAPFADPHLEPVRSSFGCTVDFLQNTYNDLWHTATVRLSLSELLELLSINRRSSLFSPDPYALFRLSSALNAVALNHVRSLHPNSFPRPFLLSCSCADDPDMMCSSWCEQYLLPKMYPIDPLDELVFHRACELYLPTGIIRRCLPRQELLGKLKSFSMSSGSTSSEQEDPDSGTSLVTAARILTICSSLASVRVVTPIYVSSCLSIFTEDYQSWLTKLCDSVDSRVPDTWKPHSAYLASLAALSFTESLFLLWQPWQWKLTTHKSDRSSTSHRLGLIQLSLRLQQLRPSLTLSQWDFFICLVISWVCSVASLLADRTPLEDHDRLFVFRTFRAATALAAMFLDCRMSPVRLDALLVPHASASGGGGGRPLPLDDSAGDEWDDDLDAEADQADPKDLDISIGDSDPIADDGDVLNDVEGTEALLLDELEQIDEEPESPVILDVNGELDDTEAATDGPILPRRGRPPPSVRTDWDNFFSSQLYSNLLPIVLRCCLSHSNSSVSCSQMDTPFHFQALCAAFATCPTSQLIRLFADNPRLILEYLVDLELSDCSSSPPVLPLISSRNCSVSQLVPGLRASFELAIRLLHSSPFQSGQLLGHILLTRLICTRTQRPGSDVVSNLSNYLIHRLPTSLLLSLSSPLPDSLERDLFSESAFDYWGRGSRALTYVTVFSVQDGWSLDLSAHRSILGYLLAWDCLLSLFTCAGPQAGARLQRALLGRSASLLDKFLLCVGLLLPFPCDLETFINSPSRFEPDERLMLPVSATRTNLIATLSALRSQTHRRPMRLPATPASGDVRRWSEPFGPDDPLLFLPGHRLSRDLSHFAVRLLRRFLFEAPSLFRNWFLRLSSVNFASNSDGSTNSAPPQSPLALHKPGRLRFLANAVDALITKHFAAVLARDEVILVQRMARMRHIKRDGDASKAWFSLWSSSKEVGSITIKCRPLLREVIATYHVTEEHSMEMLIQLPSNYPLGPTTVTCGHGVAVSSQQWHVWSVQLSMFINNQNGSILDGIDLWQQNVRKKFEGVEECAICYSILHNTNFSLPKMRCHTCRKLFHYACMYRWFTTSRNPVCPLCRHLFFGPNGRSK
ncbi:unnamed protein product [Dicrocoelium dendriticum]|nr:unnamed protein product [Dicrocoelium dendriticum]